MDTLSYDLPLLHDTQKFFSFDMKRSSDISFWSMPEPVQYIFRYQNRLLSLFKLFFYLKSRKRFAKNDWKRFAKSDCNLTLMAKESGENAKKPKM